jgi:Putative Ig domain
MIVGNRLRSFMLLATVLLASCGGSGSGPGSGSSSSPPPSALSYSAPPAFVVMQPIAPLQPTVTGAVSSFSVNPALPAGLSISAATGTISGTPTAVAAQANYTVTASNPSGTTTTQVSIAVTDVAPAVAYASSYYAFTAGVTAQTIMPKASGGAVVGWGIAPALPDGLTLNATDGSISGTPTTGAVASSYLVTATNSGGKSTASLTIAVSAGPVLDLGHGASIDLIRMNASRVLSQDASGHWVLWNYSTAGILASGTAPCQSPPCTSDPLPADLAGPTVVIGTPGGFDLRSSSSGQLLASVAASYSWWKLAADGSYVCAGGTTGLQAWSPSGQVLASRSGDYSQALAFAAPGQIQVALGPAGANVIETVSLAGGTSSVGPQFQGSFSSWFLDGSQFITTDSTANRIFIYSNTTIQEDAIIPNGSFASNVAGEGAWLWTVGSAPGLNIYKVGASASPTASFSLSGQLIASAQTLGIVGPSAVTVIDLSGAVPTQVDNQSMPAPYGASTTYAAVSGTQWMVSNRLGVLLDGASLPGPARYFGYGAALSIAGGAGHYAIATATGAILFFNSTTSMLEGTIDFPSSKIVLSADGSVLAAESGAVAGTILTDQVNVYSLPAGVLTTSFPFGNASAPTLLDMNVSASGAVVGAAVVGSTSSTLQAFPVAGGAALWDVPGPVGPGENQWLVLLSPDGTLCATAPAPQGGGTTPLTSIYSNGTFTASRSGWAVGWIDNGRLLVNNYDSKYAGYLGSSIYDPTGALLASPVLADLSAFQVVTPQQPSPDLIYSPQFNAIYSLSSGATTWASGSVSTGPYYPAPPGIGAVAGQQIVFMSGNLLLAEPH